MSLPSHAYEANDDWEGPTSFTDVLPGWEGLDPLGEDDPDQGGCIRCGTDPKGHREPFGGYPCCPSCAMWIVTDGEDDRPFVCGTALPDQPRPITEGNNE